MHGYEPQWNRIDKNCYGTAKHRNGTAKHRKGTEKICNGTEMRGNAMAKNSEAQRWKSTAMIDTGEEVSFR